MVRNGYTTRNALTVSQKFGKMFFYSPLGISGNSILRKIERAPWQKHVTPTVLQSWAPSNCESSNP